MDPHSTARARRSLLGRATVPAVTPPSFTEAQAPLPPTVTWKLCRLVSVSSDVDAGYQTGQPRYFTRQPPTTKWWPWVSVTRNWQTVPDRHAGDLHGHGGSPRALSAYLTVRIAPVREFIAETVCQAALTARARDVLQVRLEPELQQARPGRARPQRQHDQRPPPPVRASGRTRRACAVRASSDGSSR